MGARSRRAAAPQRPFGGAAAQRPQANRSANRPFGGAAPQNNEPRLPSGWRAGTDAAGRRVYINVFTSEHQYQRPTLSVAELMRRSRQREAQREARRAAAQRLREEGASRKLKPITLAQYKEKHPNMCETAPRFGICMEDFQEGDDISMLDCNHIFHRECIMPWFIQSNRN